MYKHIKSGRSGEGRVRVALAAAVVSACALASSRARAGTVTFDWVQTGGSLTASGTLTISSSLITPADATGAAQFNINSTNRPAGETFASELSSLTFTMDGDTLTQANLTSNSTGWRDNYPGEPLNVLESTWAASKAVTGGTLSLVGNSTPTGDGSLVTVTLGTKTAMGEWELAPVPLPASAWLFLSGLGGIFTVGGRRAAAARRVRTGPSIAGV